ncbi:lipoprotein precursor [Lactiplantibacillus plantarum]|uniref:Lipoprotein n=1 Tax=Lactiplantibacillus plantarum TaxID=1590 RepID=A0AAW3RGT8_LACPN|nr:lipoprotein precursor [Lactiplantibacillus plantarum]
MIYLSKWIKKKAGEVATTITVKAGPAQVGMTNSINYLTDPNAGQITETIVVN